MKPTVNRLIQVSCSCYSLLGSGNLSPPNPLCLPEEHPLCAWYCEGYEIRSIQLVDGKKTSDVRLDALCVIEVSRKKAGMLYRVCQKKISF